MKNNTERNAHRLAHAALDDDSAYVAEDDNGSDDDDDHVSRQVHKRRQSGTQSAQSRRRNKFDEDVEDDTDENEADPLTWDVDQDTASYLFLRPVSMRVADDEGYTAGSIPIEDLFTDQVTKIQQQIRKECRRKYAGSTRNSKASTTTASASGDDDAIGSSQADPAQQREIDTRSVARPKSVSQPKLGPELESEQVPEPEQVPELELEQVPEQEQEQAIDNGEDKGAFNEQSSHSCLTYFSRQRNHGSEYT